MTDRSRVADPDEAPVTAAEGALTAGLTTRQLRLLLIAIALFALSAILSFVFKLWHGYIDLQVYRNGARVWLDGGDLYGPMPKSGGIGLPFTYPPLAALVFTPLAVLPLGAAEALVLVISLASLGITLWLVLIRLRPNLERPTRLALVIGAVAVLGLTEPVRQTFNFGQINLILMAAIALDALVRKPFWPRGMLIGIAVSVKLIPGAYLLYFLIRRDWRTSITLVLSAIGAVGLGFLLFPRDSAEYWFTTLWDTDRIGPASYAGNQSLKGFAFRLGVSDGTATLIWIILSLIAVGLAALWMKRLLDAGAEIAALLVNAAAVLLISPISWSHHWVWVAPALLTAVAAQTTRGTNGLPPHHPRRGRVYTGILAAITVMFFVGPHWLLPHQNDQEARWSLWEQLIGSSYVLVTFAILAIGALAYRPPAGVRNAASAAE
ncbi:glycosyltransferase 87 family protein [Nocardia wallacei]|uniref:glycosyltransferase 87 family protein n=1 Tax=Nocardia wallacei TaxID=480035 RepID=UPI001656D976|nr:glycosyltransferase 87 family protein [Nocardia wallacei]